MRSSELKAEIQGFILAVQDMELCLIETETNILQISSHSKCRFCDTFDVTIDHYVSGCIVLIPNEYKCHHNKVEQYLHW